MADLPLQKRKFVSASPENSETPLDEIRGWVTPSGLFFVRNHFETPQIDIGQWRLSIGGCVQKPAILSFDDLAAMPHRSVLATMECAGNGRSFLQTKVHGVQWGAGAIAHGEWSGVPLKVVLDQVGLQSQALEVLLEGADRGSEADHPQPMRFARSLPLEKALHEDTLLATHLNGEPLTVSHGFPVRLLAPGWYGVASVKWLARIEVIDQPFQGYYQTKKYTIRQPKGAKGDGEQGEKTEQLRSMAVKSEIIRPRPGDTLSVGTQRIVGVAWAGEDHVERVEVSTDAGKTWASATLLGPQIRYCWTMWEHAWRAETPGEHVLLARAISTSGEVQPLSHDPLRGGYMINFCRPLAVQVVGAPPAPQDALADSGVAQTLVYDMNAFAETNARLPLDVHIEFSEGAGI